MFDSVFDHHFSQVKATLLAAAGVFAFHYVVAQWQGESVTAPKGFDVLFSLLTIASDMSSKSTLIIIS